MPKTILYLCRHGSTLLNEGNQFRGKSDVALSGFNLMIFFFYFYLLLISDLGRAQAAKIHDILQSKPIAAVLTSPRPRAIETADIVAKGHLNAHGVYFSFFFLFF
jgi:broad specificity phosphatase PhoE